MAPILFTPELACQAIPLLRSVCADMQSVSGKLAALGPVSASEQTERIRVDLVRRLNECTRELDQIGCVFKGFHDGHVLIDFPARMDRRPVFLCWRGDEPAVSHYHDLDKGFAQRRPLLPVVADPG